MFARRCGSLETENAGQQFGDFWDEIQANAIATVFSSVAALEAYANELFGDYATVFPGVHLSVMAKLWELCEQKPTLEKFEFALLLRQKPTFEKGAAPYQDVAALIKLRNALVHYKPEWSDQQSEHAKVSAVLAHRAVRSQWFAPPQSLFPRAWASYGSACWAVRSVAAFLPHFETRASLTSRVAPFLGRANTL
jgi:hypothetical protein